MVLIADVKPAAVLGPDHVRNATLSGGDWSLPLSQLQSPTISNVARSADLDSSSLVINAVFDKPRVVRGSVINGHNLTLSGGRYVHQYYSDAGMTDLLLTSGEIEAFPYRRSSVGLSWIDENFWTGLPEDEDLQGVTRQSHYLLPQPVRAHAVRTTFIDDANPDGFVELNYLMHADMFTGSVNFSEGSSLGFNVLTSSRRAKSGARYSDPVSPLRTASLVWAGLPQEESIDRAQRLFRLCGTYSPVFVIVEPENVTMSYSWAFLATFVESVTAELIQTPFVGFQFNLEELR